MGERTPVALLDAAASARLAVGRGDHEHRAPRRSRRLADVKLSANWMAAAGHPGEDARLYDAVRAVGVELCPRSASPSPSARTRCRCARRGRSGDEDACRHRAALAHRHRVRAGDRRAPRAHARARPRGRDPPSSLLVDLGLGKHRLGGSASRRSTASSAPSRPISTIRRACRGFFAAIQELDAAGLLAAYHDRTDGGLLVTLLEMAFAGGSGARGRRHRARRRPVRRAVHRGARRGRRSSRARRRARASRRSHATACSTRCTRIGAPRADEPRHPIAPRGQAVFDERRTVLRALWSETTHADAGAARRSRPAPTRSRPAASAPTTRASRRT